MEVQEVVLTDKQYKQTPKQATSLAGQRDKIMAY
jgi:hypothetical protein